MYVGVRFSMEVIIGGNWNEKPFLRWPLGCFEGK